VARSKRELLAEYFKARAKKLTAERRCEIARKAARARWAKLKKKG
jgi:hypothetical protein